MRPRAHHSTHSPSSAVTTTRRMRRRETRRRRRCAPRATIPQTTLHDAIFWAPHNSPRSDPSTPALPPSSQLTPAPAPEPAPAPIKKKKKKKKKKKSAAAEEEEDEDEVDEVTAALRELGEEMPPARDDAVDPNAPPGSSSAPRDPLMTVDLRCLKAEDELKSIFGARVIHAVELEEGKPRRRRRRETWQSRSPRPIHRRRLPRVRRARDRSSSRRKIRGHPIAAARV